MQFKGLEEYIWKLNRLADPRKAEGMIKIAVYSGAGIIADEIRKRLEGVLAQSAAVRASNKENHDKRGRTGDLADSLYLAKMENDAGYIYTQVGFAGYDSNGIPNALKANVLESGSSKQSPTPFIRPAIKAKHKTAEAVMEAELDYSIKLLMED